MSAQIRPPLEQEVQKLYDDFTKVGQPTETDAEVAAELIDLILERERIRHGIDLSSPNAEEIDSLTLARMAGWDTDDPNLLLAEKVFRRLASNQGAEAVGLLKSAIDSRAKAISEDQRRKAQVPKRAHPVNVLIEQMVTRNPAMSVKELLRALHGQIGQGVIDDIDEEYITPADTKFEEIKVDGLKDRLTRVKKKIAKAG